MGCVVSRVAIGGVSGVLVLIETIRAAISCAHRHILLGASPEEARQSEAHQRRAGKECNRIGLCDIGGTVEQFADVALFYGPGKASDALGGIADIARHL